MEHAADWQRPDFGRGAAVLDFNQDGLKDLVAGKGEEELGIYLAAGWGLLEFTGWSVERFSLALPKSTNSSSRFS